MVELRVQVTCEFTILYICIVINSTDRISKETWNVSKREKNKKTAENSSRPLRVLDAVKNPALWGGLQASCSYCWGWKFWLWLIRLTPFVFAKTILCTVTLKFIQHPLSLCDVWNEMTNLLCTYKEGLLNVVINTCMWLCTAEGHSDLDVLDT